jgi:hypothetical protein
LSNEGAGTQDNDFQLLATSRQSKLNRTFVEVEISLSSDIEICPDEVSGTNFTCNDGCRIYTNCGCLDPAHMTNYQNPIPQTKSDFSDVLAMISPFVVTDRKVVGTVGSTSKLSLTDT